MSSSSTSQSQRIKAGMAKAKTDPRQPLRTYRAPDDVYLPAQAAAKANGEDLAVVIRRALSAYAEAYAAHLTAEVSSQAQWTRDDLGVYHRQTPYGEQTIDGSNAGRNRWTITYLAAEDYGMVDTLKEAKAWANDDLLATTRNNLKFEGRKVAR